MADMYSLNLLMFSAALGFSSVASYFDVKTGEIPDKFTVGLVVVALAMRAAFSAMLGDFNYLLDGLLVGGIFFGFGAALFYTGGWGGGDTKLIAGIGASLGGLVAPSLLPHLSLLPAFLGFFIAMSLVAIPYSLAYALGLALRTRKVFTITKKKLQETWMLLAMAAIASAAMIIVLKPWSAVLFFCLLSPPLFYLMIVFVRSVEENAMQKEISIGQLKEGDMVAEDIIVKGKKLASKRDMDGLSKKALAKIKKSGLRKIKIRWGMRFAPAFPLALLVAPFWSSIIAVLI